MQLIFLTTDILLWFLVCCTIAYVYYASKTPLLRHAWFTIFQRPAAMAMFVPLLFFASIALLDSIHFKQSSSQTPTISNKTIVQKDVVSVLDLLTVSLITKKEKTYSSPLAYESFSKENIDKGDIITREFPRLKYAGQHLQSTQEHTSDIFKKISLIILIMLFSVIITFLITAMIEYLLEKQSFRQALQNVFKGTGLLPWRALLLSLNLIVLVISYNIIMSLHYYALGTDKVGNDVLYIAIKSIRTAIVIGTLTTLITLPIGIILGILAGYFRGWIDDIIQYIYTTLNSIPDILLIAASVLMLQIYIDAHPEKFSTILERADIRLVFLCLILGLTSWTGLCRLIRAETMKLRELEYVQAARAFGANHIGIMLKHIFPNLMHIVLITIVMDFSGTVLSESILSYVGVGVDPSMHSFGNMINVARSELAREPIVWWPLITAFTCLFILVLAANLFADVVRDAFDPKAQGRH